MHVITSLSRGGAERLVSELLPIMKADGAEVSVATLLDRLELAPRLREAGIRIHVLGTEFPGGKLGKLLGIRRRLRDAAEEEGVEIFHSHLFLPTMVACLVSPRRIRVVTTIHNIERWWNWSRVKGGAWDKIRSFFMYSFDRLCARLLPVRFVAISDAVRQAAIDMVKVPPEHVRTISNGVPLDDFIPKDVYGDTRSPVVIQVGNLHWRKGGVVSLRAFRLVKDRFAGARLMVVGDGSQRRIMDSMIDELGLRGSAELLGVRDDVPELLRLADVYWMPSYVEGLGIACLEAMACGLPAITSNVPGLNEVVIDGETGFQVAPGDHESLASRTVEVIENPELARRMGIAARKRVEDFYSIRMSAEKYLKAYGDILEGKW